MLAIIRAVVAQGGSDETEAAAIDHVDDRRSLQIGGAGGDDQGSDD